MIAFIREMCTLHVVLSETIPTSVIHRTETEDDMCDSGGILESYFRGSSKATGREGGDAGGLLFNLGRCLRHQAGCQGQAVFRHSTVLPQNSTGHRWLLLW